MKKAIAILLTMACLLTLVSAGATAAEEHATEEEIKSTAEAFLSASAKNMWLYESNDLNTGTIQELAATPARMADSMSSVGLQADEIRACVEDISFAQEKTEYFKEMRQEQNIQRNDFNMQYSFAAPQIDGNQATVYVVEYISFHYPDFPDVLSEAINYYNVTLLKVDHEWLIAGVTAENDDFDAAYKGTGFTADRAEEIFAAEAAKAISDERASDAFMDQYGLVEEGAEDLETQALAATNTYYDYNPDNATAYAYTYVTGMFGIQKWKEIDDTNKAIGRSFWNQNFKSFATSDCQNFASQCIWVGFNGSNSINQIYDANTATYSPIMDRGGSYKWCGTIPGKSVNSDSWTVTNGATGFNTYIKNEIASGDPDMIVTKGSVSLKQNFSSVYTELKGALLHVNNEGHAIIVTDVSGPERSQILYCGHTADRKALSLADSYPDDKLIYYYIPKQMKIRTVPEVKITGMLERPVAKGSYIELGGSTDVTCASIHMSIKSPNGTTYTKTSSNRSISGYYTLSEGGLYTITLTAKKTTTSSPVVYVYTVRTY